MSSTGTITSTSSGLRTPASTIVTGDARCRRLNEPPRNRAISSSGRCVADSPMRCGRCARQSRHRAVETLERQREMCAALGGGERVDLVDDHVFDGAQRVARRRRQHEIERLGCRDEDVGRMTQQRAAITSPAVSPVRRPTVGTIDRRAQAVRQRARCPPTANGGSCRHRPPAPAAARCRGPACPAAAGPGRSSAGRCSTENAASVLPEPVGARISACSPAAIAGQPSACACVGSPKVVEEPLTYRRREVVENHESTIPRPTDSRFAGCRDSLAAVSRARGATIDGFPERDAGSLDCTHEPPAPPATTTEPSSSTARPSSSSTKTTST